MSKITDASCFLCKNESSSGVKYEVTKTYSSTTVTLLSKLIEDAINEKVFVSESVGQVCGVCCKMLNELDSLQKKMKDITEKLRGYLNCGNTFATSNAYCQTEIKNAEVQEPVIDILSPKYEIEQSQEGPFACKRCGSGFRSNEELKEHLKTHVIKSYDCLICKKSFLSKNGLNAHQKRQHRNVRVMEIEYDVKNEEDTTDVNQEAGTSTQGNNKTSISVKRYQCTECPKLWRTLGELKSHIATHSDAKPFVCEVCGQCYKQKSALEIHVGMHNGVNPFTCQYCHKSFTQKGALQRHMPIHTGETPYQCDICGKRFVHHSSFNIHRLSHTGEKAFKCEQCGLYLYSTSHLKRHMRVHTGEKNYMCLTCGKRFAEKYNLMSHQKLHNDVGERTFKRKFRCQFCDMLFEGKLKLNQHMLQEHISIDDDIIPSTD